MKREAIIASLFIHVKGVFQMGGFDRYIESFTDREKALASF
jgi:hypothetical protein